MDPYEQYKIDEAFNVTLEERYKRLSLLTLDLAEEAGEAARNMASADKGGKPTRFERRIGAMSRAIWAHKEIERLRKGRPFKRAETSIEQKLRQDRMRETGELPSDTWHFLRTGDWGPRPSPISSGPTSSRPMSPAAPIAPAYDETPHTDDTPPPGQDDIEKELEDEFDEDALNAAIEQALDDEKSSAEILKAAIDAPDDARDDDARNEMSDAVARPNPRAPP